MRNLDIFCIASFLLSTIGYSQDTIKGTFPALSDQQVKLVGFEGFVTYVIDSVQVSDTGVFQLAFTEADHGMGYLAGDDGKPFIVILAAGEDLKLEGEGLSDPETVVIVAGLQNQLFGRYAAEHPRREQALSAWDLLDRSYSSDPLFAVHQPRSVISAERERIREEDHAFLAGLDPGSYCGWYLPLRKLVSSVPAIAQYRSEQIPAAIAAFRNIDHAGTELYKSGSLRETLEAHFWLIENSGSALDVVQAEMRNSIDRIVEDILTDEIKQNLIIEYLFNLLEKRSMVEASEYLALKVLNEKRCTIEKGLAAQLESYRAMKLGTIAPNFVFPDDRLTPGYSQTAAPKELSDIKSAYTLLVFGASWCPACSDELFQIVRVYEKWKIHGVEVVFVSLDEEERMFRNYTGIFPFVSVCDYQKWDGPVVKAYHVFATPSLYLLNDKREILLRPSSVQQMDAWVEWYLVQGNR